MHGETDHPAEGPHLRLGNSVTRMVGKRRMVHLFDCRMAAEELDYGESIRVVPFHPYAQRLDPALHEEAVEGSGNGAGRILKETKSSRDVLVAGGGKAADDVGVTTEDLVVECTTMSAPRLRGCCIQGVAKVLSTTTRAPRLGAAADTAAMSITWSNGFVGDSSHTMRVAGRHTSSISERSTVSITSPAGRWIAVANRYVPP